MRQFTNLISTKMKKPNTSFSRLCPNDYSSALIFQYFNKLYSFIMETKSTIQTQRTLTVLFAFIARLVGLRSYNFAFLPPLSTFQISDVGFRTFGGFARAMTTSFVMAWLFAFALALPLHAQYTANFSVPDRGLVRPRRK